MHDTRMSTGWSSTFAAFYLVMGFFFAYLTARSILADELTGALLFHTVGSLSLAAFGGYTRGALLAREDAKGTRA
jgi:hypothetical protein